MLKGNWLFCAAIGGCLIAALLLLPILAVGKERPDDKANIGEYAEPQADPEKSKAAFDAWFWRGAANSPDTYRDICEHPQDRDYADLCQQWRSAKAAEESARWALPQLIANIFTVIGLLVTIGLTYCAISLNRREFLAAHRPEIHIHSIRVLPFDHSPPPDQQPIKVEFSIVNQGTGDCEIIGSAVYLDYLYPIDWREFHYLPRLQPNNAIRPQRLLVGATNSYTVQTNELGGAIHLDPALGKILYLSGWIVYREKNKATRTTYFSRKYEREGDIFTNVDDPDANCIR